MVDMSSSVPTDTVALGADLAKLGFRLIDAPVSGGVKRAVDGTLTIMVGGDEASLAQARPLLEAMGSKIFPTGRLGSGHAMKALNNFVSAAGVVAAMEAVIAGRKFGLDPERMIDILNVSTGRNNATEVKMKPFVLSETYASGFGLGLMAKDVGIAAGLAQSLGLHLPMLHEAAQLWRDAAGTLGAASDHTEIIKHIVAAAEKGEPA